MIKGLTLLRFQGTLVVGFFALACGGSAASTTGDASGGTRGTGGSDGTGGDGGAGPRMPLDAASFCDRLVNECKSMSLTYDECLPIYATMRITSECESAIDAATCEDLMAEDSASAETCFPPCDTLGSTCNEDGTLTKCGNTGGGLHLFVLDCEDVCATTDDSPTWTGVCGTTYGTQTTTDNKCWCD